MLEHKNGSCLVLPGMKSLIGSDKKILILIESMATLSLVDLKVLVRLFIYQSSKPQIPRDETLENPSKNSLSVSLYVYQSL